MVFKYDVYLKICEDTSLSAVHLYLVVQARFFKGNSGSVLSFHNSNIGLSLLQVLCLYS
jgi:hypothetical protein